jgi:CheY-like chemotaxis protein
MKVELVMLLAEDDENDAFLFRMAFEKAGSACILKHVPDGGAAIDYLMGCDKYADRAKHPFPSVVITDLKMPRANGFDLLAWIQTELPHGSLPTIVLSGSVEERDKKRAAELGAKAYWVKPAGVDELASLIGHVMEVAFGLRSAA